MTRKKTWTTINRIKFGEAFTPKFWIKNEDSFVKYQKITNLRKFDGEVLTNSDVMERIKHNEEAAF